MKVTVCLLVSMSLLALLAKAQKSDYPSRFEIQTSAGYSAENFDWSIAGKNSNGESVNILSELRWKRSGGVNINLGAQWNFWKRWIVQFKLSQTFITSGIVSDSDFGSSNRRDTLFYATFDSDKGGVSQYQAALGYRFYFENGHSIVPFSGYGNVVQSLFLLKENGNIQGDLKSTYETQWTGPFVGSDLHFVIHKKLLTSVRITYHQLNYSARANWNLIDEFQHPISFKHAARGYGLETTTAIEYLFHKKISARIATQYCHQTTGKGKDTLYRTNGDIVLTQLNSIHRNSLIISLGIQLALGQLN